MPFLVILYDYQRLSRMDLGHNLHILCLQFLSSHAVWHFSLLWPARMFWPQQCVWETSYFSPPRWLAVVWKTAEGESNHLVVANFRWWRTQLASLPTQNYVGSRNVKAILSVNCTQTKDSCIQLKIKEKAICALLFIFLTSTQGALRLTTTYDNQSHPIQPTKLL